MSAPYSRFLVEKRSVAFRSRSARYNAAGRTSASRQRSMRDGPAKLVKRKLHRDRFLEDTPQRELSEDAQRSSFELFRLVENIVLVPATEACERSTARLAHRRVAVVVFSLENIVLVPGARAFASGDWRLWAARRGLHAEARIDASGAMPTSTRSTKPGAPRALPTVCARLHSRPQQTRGRRQHAARLGEPAPATQPGARRATR